MPPSEVEALDKLTKVTEGLVRPREEIVRLAQCAMTWARLVEDEPPLRDRVVAITFTLFWALRGFSTDELLIRALGAEGMAHITQAIARKALEGEIPQGLPEGEAEPRSA